MDKNLLKNRNEIFKNDILVSIVLGVFVSIFAAAIVFVNYVGPLISVLLIPFIVLPFLFAAQATFFDTQRDNPLTFKSFFLAFISFFKGSNLSTYSFIRSFLKSLLAYAITSTICSIVGVSVLYSSNPEGMNQMAQLMQEYIANMNINQTIEEILGETYPLYLLLSQIVTIPPLVVFGGMLSFYILRNGAAFFLRLQMPNSPQVVYRNVFNKTLSLNRKSFMKDYFSLNWPLHVLYILVAGGSAYLGTLFIKDAYQVSAFAISLGILSMMFYMPLYFSNQMAIFLKYQKKFVESSFIITQEMLNMVQRRMDLNEQDKEVLEKAFEELSKAQKEFDEGSKENKNEENNDSEDTKKVDDIDNNS